MKFSLLVPTVNRTAELRRLFASLAEQTCGDFEVLVADQNPPGLLQPLYREFESAFALRVFTVPHQGVSQARNALLPHISGEYAAFPDDDCWYMPDTLRTVAEVFENQDHAQGLVACWLEASPKQSGVLTRYSAFSGAGTHTQFYRKTVVESVGGFDQTLGPGTGLPYGCGEDTDYLLRVLEKGFTVLRAPSVSVRHPAVNLRDPALREKARAYAKGRMYLLRKHKMPLWFVLANIAYPLLSIPKDCLRECLRQCADIARYRWAMFTARLAAWNRGEAL